MFAGRSSFGLHTMPLVNQGKPGEAYSENTRWELGDAVFVGLNVPGSNNNRINDPTGPECTDKSARTPADCQADNDEYSARTHADIDWLHQAFGEARAGAARAVMIIMQADPGFDLPETSVNERNDPAVDGYTDLLNALAVAAVAESGHPAPAPFRRIRHIVVIYEENHSFDNLWGGWPGVDGLAGGLPTQVGQDGRPLQCLPQNDVNLTSPPLAPVCTATLADGKPVVSHFPAGPFTIDDYVPPDATTCFPVT